MGNLNGQFVLELMREINDVVSRQFIDSHGPAGCRVVPLADGPSYSGRVGCRLVGHADSTAEEIRMAVPFAALTRREKIDVLDTFIGWDRFRDRGLTTHDENTIWGNVMAGKPRDRWLEGTSIL